MDSDPDALSNTLYRSLLPGYIILENQTTFTYKDTPFGENALRRFLEWSWQTDGH